MTKGIIPIIDDISTAESPAIINIIPIAIKNEKIAALR